MAEFTVDEKATKKADQKKPRRISVKNPSFFLFRKFEENGNLSPIDSCETEANIRSAYEKALDENIPEKQLIGFKGRFLKFEVKETKRRIAVR